MNNITPVYIALFEGWKLVVEKHAKGDTCEPRRCFSLTTPPAAMPTWEIAR